MNSSVTRNNVKSFQSKLSQLNSGRCYSYCKTFYENNELLRGEVVELFKTFYKVHGWDAILETMLNQRVNFPILKAFTEFAKNEVIEKKNI